MSKNYVLPHTTGHNYPASGFDSRPVMLKWIVGFDDFNMQIYA